jgi:Tol biopolymer transport system component/serine/threonine protein kinase
MSRPRQPHPFENLAGQHIGNGSYVLQALYHRSHMSVLYRSLDAANGQPRAVKILLSEKHLDRFKNEARLADALQHPNIVKTYHYQIQGEPVPALNTRIHYIVMRWLNQDSLEAIIAKENARAYFVPRYGQSFTGSPDTTLDSRLGVAMLVLHNLADAFDYLHQRVSIINRDVKPSNIQFHEGEPFLLDFGIAKRIRDDASTMVGDEPGLTNAHELPGTLRYMAPEQWTYHELSGQTDQYQLALTIYELISGGRSPYDQFRHQAGMETGINQVSNTRYEVRRRIWSEAHIHSMPTPLHEYVPNVPGSIWEVLSKAMSKMPHERFNTVTEFAYAFFAALPPELQTELPVNTNTQRLTVAPSYSTSFSYGGDGMGATPHRAVRAAGHGRGYWLSMLMLFVILVLLIGAGGILLTSSGGDDNNDAADDGRGGLLGVIGGDTADSGEGADISTAPLVGAPSLIAYDTGSGNEREIYLYDPGSDTIQQITDNNIEDKHPTLSHDRQELAYIAVENDQPSVIIYNLDNGRTSTIAMHQMETIGALDWSPNGRVVVMAASVDEGMPQLYRLDLESGSGEFLSDIADAIPYYCPRWSPDGQRIAFHSDFEGTFDVYTLNLNDNRITPLIDLPESAEIGAAWAPDGSQIVFASNQTGNFDIYVVDLLSGRLSQLTTAPDDEELSFFAPDGQQLVYSINGVLHIMELASGDSSEAIENQGITGNPFSWR